MAGPTSTCLKGLFFASSLFPFSVAFPLSFRFFAFLFAPHASSLFSWRHLLYACVLARCHQSLNSLFHDAIRQHRMELRDAAERETGSPTFDSQCSAPSRTRWPPSTGSRFRSRGARGQNGPAVGAPTPAERSALFQDLQHNSGSVTEITASVQCESQIGRSFCRARFAPSTRLLVNAPYFIFNPCSLRGCSGPRSVRRRLLEEGRNHRHRLNLEPILLWMQFCNWCMFASNTQRLTWYSYLYRFLSGDEQHSEIMNSTWI